jgi:plastocyanin
VKTRPAARFVLATALLSASVACSAKPASQQTRAAAPEKRAEEAPAKKASRPAPKKPARVDPRSGGFEIVLGEWAVTPEARAIRPGKVTFVVHNRGTMGHGYEMELEGGDSSGPGSGDLFKAESELVRPGESTRMTVTLPPGLYEIECLVDGHDDMGMEGVLEVRPDAPLVEVDAPARAGRIAIADFAFDPPVAEVAAGTEVVWRNSDPADHTVTNTDGVFGSDVLKAGDTFSHRFSEPGVYEYQCAIHPEMKGKVKVE